MSEKGQIGMDPHGGASESVTGLRDEHMAESQPILGPEGRQQPQDAGSSTIVNVSEEQRSKSPVPKGRRTPQELPHRGYQRELP